MSEAATVTATREPWTRQALVDVLHDVGVRNGDVISVHSSLSRLGWVIGGAETVVTALIDAVGASGTVVMQTHSAGNSDPAQWENPPVPAAWWATIYESMPAYCPRTTPTRQMGAVVDCFRHWPDFVRSDHPSDSCGAVGRFAAEITADHPLSSAFGPGSPLSRLVELDARVVLLGVDHGNDTLLHYAEHLAACSKVQKRFGSAMTVDGRREWVWRDDLDHDSDDFARLGEDFAATGCERRHGPVRSCRARELIDFAVPWLTAQRP